MNPAIEQMLMSLAVMIDEQVDAYDWYHRQKVAFLQHRTAAAAVADGDWQAVEAFLRRVQADLARERQDLEDSHAPYFVAAPMQDLLSV